MDNFDKKKMGRGRPPVTYLQIMIYTPFISMVVLKKTQIFITNAFNKKLFGHAEYFFTFCLKKSTFFSGRGVDPPPLKANMSVKSRVFFLPFPNLLPI